MMVNVLSSYALGLRIRLGFNCHHPILPLFTVFQEEKIDRFLYLTRLGLDLAQLKTNTQIVSPSCGFFLTCGKNKQLEREH
jgi:hypothetical protein